MDNKKVSIIVPCYNCGRYLAEGIESILNQTYKNIELIIIDDGSTDDSVEIANKYAKRGRLRLIKQQHLGVSEARNRGINESSGEYIFFMDSDDTLHEKCIEILVNHAEENEAELVVIRHLNKFTNNTKKPELSQRKEIVNGHTAAIEMLSYKITIASAGRLYESSLIRGKVNFEKNIRYGEGFNFLIESMLLSKRVVITDQELYNYRVNSLTSVMSTIKPGMIEDSLFAIDRIESKVPNTADFKNAVKYARFHTACDMLNTIIAVRKEMAKISGIKKIIKDSKVDISNLDLSKKEVLKYYAYKVSPIFVAKIKKRLGKRKYYA